MSRALFDTGMDNSAKQPLHIAAADHFCDPITEKLGDHVRLIESPLGWYAITKNLLRIEVGSKAFDFL